MDKRIRLGFVYLWDKKWMGGMYYVQNLLISFKSLGDNKMPLVNLYCIDAEIFDIISRGTDYPYLEKTIIKISKTKRILKILYSLISFKAAARINTFYVNPDDDILFPYSNGVNTRKLVYWRPDFQEKHLPGYFSKFTIFRRDFGIKEVCERKVPIVFSSEDCKKDFQRFYPQYANNPTYVVRFAVNQPDFSEIDIDVLKKKYGINKHYFFCANQFWAHKNHLFLFKVFKKAVEAGLDMQLVCTGRMHDKRNPNYIQELQDFIISNDLSSRILTLGMIDKLELLCLMKNSYAVIQPSLFEGWNTTVEDCKAMSKFVFLSNLEVHKEQMDKNVCFFDPHREEDLFEKLMTVMPREENYDYSNNIKQFGEDFYQVLHIVLS